MKLTWIIATLALLAGCAQPLPPDPYWPHNPPSRPTHTPLAAEIEVGDLVTLTPQQQQQVRVGTAKRLKDPEAARFGKISATRAKDGSITVCGYVNGKNSYGGYVGMSPFMGMFLAPPNGNTYEVVKIGSRDTEQQAIVSVCGQAGVPMSL